LEKECYAGVFVMSLLAFPPANPVGCYSYKNYNCEPVKELLAMRSKVTQFACLGLICILCITGNAQQSAAATLQGRVVDPHGAVITHADIVATQKDTGIKRATTSNDEGIFVLTNLPPGDYEVNVKANGFTEKTYSSVTLLVGQTVTLDTALEVGK